MQDTVKLFEIPVYGLSKETLKHRVEARITELKKECESNNVPEAHQMMLIENQTYPMKIWEYNHIVGFIKVSANGHDVLFEVFMRYDGAQKYLWWASRKHFVRNAGTSGLHFYHGNMKTNAQIQQRIAEMLHDIIDAHIPKRYFVDTQAFDSINIHVDYLSLLHK